MAVCRQWRENALRAVSCKLRRTVNLFASRLCLAAANSCTSACLSSSHKSQNLVALFWRLRPFKSMNYILVVSDDFGVVMMSLNASFDSMDSGEGVIVCVRKKLETWFNIVCVPGAV